MIKKRLTDCAEGLWKNGQGKTRQVAIYPHEATLANNDFHWRLSSATILGDNTFSQFEGFDRWLIVWKGEGLQLNNEKLLPHTPLHFRGEDPIQCSLLQNEVIDLGLIYDRKKYKADLKVFMKVRGGTVDVRADKGTHFVFLAEGTATVGNHTMLEGEFLILENKSILLELSENARAYQFSIEHF